MTPDASGMSFPWQRGYRISFLVFGLILLSAFGHAVTFYLFRVEYPPTARVTPPPAQIRLLQPNTSANRELLNRIADSDPASLFRPPDIDAPKTGPFPYVPSYAMSRTAPASVPPESDSTQPTFRPAVGGLALMDRMLTPGASPTSAPTPALTTLEFSSAIADRVPEKGFDFEFTPVETTTLSPAKYFVGVNRNGEPELVFLQSGSGEESLDRQAEAFLRNARFTAAEGNGEIDWGFVTFRWGPEVVVTPQKSVGKP